MAPLRNSRQERARFACAPRADPSVIMAIGHSTVIFVLDGTVNCAIASTVFCAHTWSVSIAPTSMRSLSGDAGHTETSGATACSGQNRYDAPDCRQSRPSERRVRKDCAGWRPCARRHPDHRWLTHSTPGAPAERRRWIACDPKRTSSRGTPAASAGYYFLQQGLN
jgi:hypothetical protein